MRGSQARPYGVFCGDDVRANTATVIELIQITNDPEFARRCDQLGGIRLFIDLERLGKAERQAGRKSFISSHEFSDVSRIKAVLKESRLMVRVNPLHAATTAEVDQVLERGADLLMLPMFDSPAQVHEFAAIVAGRAPIVPLLETASALESIDDWIATTGLEEVYVGLNDLHLSLGCRFMFEPVAQGLIDRIAGAAKRQGLRFGFGGIARLDEGLLPGREVLAEHLRLGSQAVILSRTFHRSDAPTTFEVEVEAIRKAEQQLGRRDAAQIETDHLRVVSLIKSIVNEMERTASIV